MKWYVTSKNIDEIVEADDQWGAFAAVRTRPVEDFGLVVEAQPVNETVEQARAIRTSALFGKHWGMPDIGLAFVRAAIDYGLPDTSAEDIEARP